MSRQVDEARWLRGQEITKVEVFLVDLKPTMKRTDAIQSFVSQETPIVRITDADGAVGHRLHLHHRHRRPVGARAARATISCPRLIGRDADEIEGIWRDAVLPHPCDHGRRDHLDRAGRDRHRAVGPALPRAPACRCDGMAGGAQHAVAALHDRRRLAAYRAAALVEDALARQGGRASAAPRSRSAGRMSRRTSRACAAVREAVGHGFEIMTDANQGFTLSTRRSGAPGIYEPLDIAWFEEPMHADDVGGHVRLARIDHAADRGRRVLYSIAISRNIWSAAPASIVQVDVGAHRRHHALAQGRASGRGLQRRGLPAFPDGAARLRSAAAVPERPLGRIHPAARSDHDSRMRIVTAWRFRPTMRGSGSSGTWRRSERMTVGTIVHR